MTGRPHVGLGLLEASVARESLAGRWFRLRNGLLGSRSFQRWAARIPLLRWIARRRMLRLFDLCAGFVYSQVLLAAVRVGLFQALERGPQTVVGIAPRLSLSEDATRRLLEATTSLELTEHRSGGQYGLGIQGAALLANPAVTRMVEHHALVYRDLADPVALLRGERRDTELHRFWPYAGSGGTEDGEQRFDRYSELMSGSVELIAEDILDAYPLGQHRRLLDVGGGDGAFLERVAERVPGLSLVLFDLPPVAARALARFTQPGRNARAVIVGGDALRDPLPEGVDVVSLIRVVHDHEDAQALDLLRAVRRALVPGGVVLIAEPMAGTAGAERVAAAYFGFYLLAMGQGRLRTPEELSALLHRAGFVHTSLRRTRRPVLGRLLIAQAP
jgi:demethylspheroidene O-methyltransferase